MPKIKVANPVVDIDCDEKDAETPRMRHIAAMG